MADAFSAATAALFKDPNLATTGTYTPRDGAPVTVKVLRAAPRPVTLEVGRGGASSDLARPFEVLTSEVPDRPYRGATLEVDGTLYEVENAEARARGTVWFLDVRKA
ncbi:MAG: hypothetical protein SFV21_00310 [Rhodospirillaceae bacterium]|nr:hypothetical protein [Rhodospirillaceae bacterium]